MITRDSKNIRNIHTGLYSNVAFEVIDSVLGQLSDGWGENNPANEKWWRFADVRTEPNGEVVIAVSLDHAANNGYCGRYHWISNGFYDMSEAQIKEKFAKWIKKTMQMELKDNRIRGGWKRNNTSFFTSYLNRKLEISVAQVYCICDQLLGCLCDLGKYGPDILDSAFGDVKNEDQIAKEVAKRQKLAEIDAHAKAQYEEIVAWKKQELEKIEKIEKAKRDRVWKEHQAQRAELKAF